MAERAHPEDPAFQDRRVWRRRLKGLIPWPQFVRSPWKKGLIARYKFCQCYAAGKRVLDIPCGVGWGTSLLQGTHQLVGVDLSQEAIEYARSHYSDKANFMVGDMRQLPFADESFDLVICLEGIEHVPVDVGKQFIREAKRVLLPSGQIIVTNPLPDPKRLPNPYHVYEYKFEELRALLEPWFRTKLCDIRDIGGIPIVYYLGEVRKGFPHEDA